LGRRSDHSPAELRRLALDAARQIIQKQGFAALSTRAVAREIGYASGTLYQHFENFDDLVEQVNRETIDAFRARCERVELTDDPAENLTRLAAIYAAFTSENANLWAAVFDHQRPVRSEEYAVSVGKIMTIVERAIAPYYLAGQEAERLHDARVLWMWLYGVSTLARRGMLGQGESAGKMLHTVIEMYTLSRKPAVMSKSGR